MPAFESAKGGRKEGGECGFETRFTGRWLARCAVARIEGWGLLRRLGCILGVSASLGYAMVECLLV